MKTLQQHERMTWMLLIVLEGGCASDLPVMQDGGSSEGSTAGGSESSTSTSGNGANDTGSTGMEETSDTLGDTGTEPGCGNGVLDAMESCDEAGQTSTCDEDCTPVACGDGLVNAAAGEQCDDAGVSATCNLDCTSSSCGDGQVNALAGEQCDDGGESAACDVDCTPATCGDGVFNAMSGEECDDAGRSAACNGNCSLGSCGDGILNLAAGEACDDAGESASCNVDCSLVACGDGVTNAIAGEVCDDAGPSLGCDEDCTLVTCGDGLANLVAGEECDHAGGSATCDEDCTEVVCGDGVLNALAGEACDTAELAGGTCQGLGYGPGTLACGGGCSYSADGCTPMTPVLQLAIAPIKRFDFSWAPALGAQYYQLLESPAPGEPYAPLGGDVVGESVSFEMPLHLRLGATYVLRACNAAGCTDSAAVGVPVPLAEAVGYVKAVNTDPNDWFGYSVALSEDGNTLAVGAYQEDSVATGVGGNHFDDSAFSAGAVYVFVRTGMGTWEQQAYVKASNTQASDYFGNDVALSSDGNTLAVGAHNEDSAATGIDGNQFDESASNAGAAYVFTRSGAGVWSQQAYVKASNTGENDEFGYSVALSADGNTLAVGADQERSNATGIGGNQADDSAYGAGAVYVLTRNEMGGWSHQAYVKASNAGSTDFFGTTVALSGDGDTLAVGAMGEDSGANGINGNGASNSSSGSGAAYVFTRDVAGTWSQQAYVKASNTHSNAQFGFCAALSSDGDTLAIAANREQSGATGVGGNQADNSASYSGAVYVLTREGMGNWVQQAYVKASNTSSYDEFGTSVALSGDGNVLAIGARYEDGNAAGIGGIESDESASSAGAAYVLTRDVMGTWSQRAYVKAPNTEANDQLGTGVALSGDGHTLAVGAAIEDGSATGIGGNQADNSAGQSGAVYLY